MNTTTDTFYRLAKESGNKLRAYILSVSSGGTAVFFLVLTKPEIAHFTHTEKTLLIISLVCFVLTVILSLYELRIDAKRFFNIAKELKKDESSQNWQQNEKYKMIRYWLIHSTFLPLGLGIFATSILLILKILYV